MMLPLLFLDKKLEPPLGEFGNVGFKQKQLLGELEILNMKECSRSIFF
jgi:hypothetical protein